MSKASPKRRHSNPRSHRLGVESLEPRALLTAASVLPASVVQVLNAVPALNYGDNLQSGRDGSFYLSVPFQGTFDFDGGPGIANLTSAGGVDMAVAKYAPDGTLLWARRFGGVGDDVSLVSVLDRDGGIYLKGQLNSATADFGSIIVTNGNPTPTSHGKPIGNPQGMFLTKLDANGNFKWAISPTVSTIQGYPALAVDDTSTNRAAWVVDTVPLPTASGNKVPIFSQLNAGSGAVIRTQTITKNGDSWLVGVYDMAVDARGYLTMHGQLNGSGSLTFGNKTITSANGNRFVTRYTGSSNFPWTVQFPGLDPSTSTNGLNFGSGDQLQVDSAGNTYLGGKFTGTVDFDPGPGSALRTSTTPYGDGFVLAVSDGGNFRWVTTMSSASTTSSPWINPNSLALDSAGTVYEGGEFSGDTGTFGDKTLANAADDPTALNNAFAVQLDPANGSVVGAWNAHGHSATISADSSGNVYMEVWFGLATGKFPTGDPEVSPGMYLVTFQPAPAAAAQFAVATASIGASTLADASLPLLPAADDQSPLAANCSAQRHVRRVTPDAAASSQLLPNIVDEAILAATPSHIRRTLSNGTSSTGTDLLDDLFALISHHP